MTVKPQRYTVRDGHVAGVAPTVYLWRREDAVLYVGATWLHPAARVALHLHGPERSRLVGAARECAGISRDGPFEVIAFPVPDSLDRQRLKQGLIAALSAADQLGDAYIGPAPAPLGPALSAAEVAWLDAVLENGT